MKTSMFYFYSFLVFTFLFSSCVKEQVGSLNQNKVNLLELRTIVVPEIENGTMKFNSKEEAFSYMNELTRIMDENKNGDESPEDYINPAISLNSSIKRNYNFSSLYDANPKDEDGFLITSIFPDFEFNLMMNPNYEIIIGDRIYVHKNTTEHYHINKNDIANRDLLRRINPGEFLNRDNNNGGIEIDGPNVDTRTPCKCTFKLVRTINSNINRNEFILSPNCPKSVTGQTWVMTWTSSDGLSSGTTTGTVNHVVTPDNLFPNDIFFIVPASVGDFNIKFCLMSDCGDGLKEYCFDHPFVLGDDCCKKLDNSKQVSNSFPDKGFKLVAKYENGSNFWGYYHYGLLRFVSLSTGKQLKAKTLEIWFDATNRTSFIASPSCDPRHEKDKDFCRDCKWISENMYDDVEHIFHKPGEVVLDFKGKRHDTEGTHKIIPVFCN